MHLPDGVLDPRIWATFDAVSAGVVGITVRKVSKNLDEKKIPMMGVMAAFIFAAQLINVPTPGGPPVHLVGAVLAAILLGPWEATLVMASVLSVQCLVFQDGGLLALGVNVFNIGILGTFGGYYLYRLIRKVFSGGKGMLAASFAAPWIIVLISTGVVAAEMIYSGATPAKLVLPTLGVFNIVVGGIEGLVTASIVGFVMRVRKDLIFNG